MISLKELAKIHENNNMPDSPDVKIAVAPVSPASSHPPVSTTPRSTSNNSAMNGGHSPSHSLYNGLTPSPPSSAPTQSISAQQLPPACGARQLSKLKRFLTTLQQFGTDISPEIGERVRTLVLGLMNNHLSIEEFHAKLQEATNFPLRPFVIPFLKANLPLLQRELLHCARLAKQTPQQYLAHNEHILFDPSNPTMEAQDNGTDVNDNGKRRSPDSQSKENGFENSDSMHPSKRHHTISPSGGSTSSRVSPNMPYGYHLGGSIRLEDISMSREMRERERVERERVERDRFERERDRDRQLSGFQSYHRQDNYESLDRSDDEWKYIDNMLNSIITMVDKTKRAISILQDRSQRDREELAMWMRRHAEGMGSDVKKRTSEMMASQLRQTEDRVTDVKRRAEEAVQEVKRQAVAELQRAVGAAERKASELITEERQKAERAIADARRQAQQEYMAASGVQEESSQTCWNCGRKANETCSGCNVARYCSAFCQHKDWENHHHVCNKPTAVREVQAARDGRSMQHRQAGMPPSLEEPSPFSSTSGTSTTESISVSVPNTSSTNTLHSSSAACTSPKTSSVKYSSSSPSNISPKMTSPPSTPPTSPKCKTEPNTEQEAKRTEAKKK